MDNEEFFKKVQEECKNMDSYATDWQKVRIQAAISAMQGIAAQTGYISADDIAKKAISYADALVKELKGE